MSLKKIFNYYRDNFNLRFNQYLLFVGILLLLFYVVLDLTGKKNDHDGLVIRFMSAFSIILLGYAVIFFVQVPLYKFCTKKYIDHLVQISVSMDEMLEYKVKERTHTFAMLNFYVPEYVVSFFNNEYQCGFELISINLEPPYINSDLSEWKGKSIVIYADPEMLKKKSGTKKKIKIFNFKGVGFDLENSFFKSVSEYVSLLPKYIFFYILFPILTLGIFLLAITTYSEGIL